MPLIFLPAQLVYLWSARRERGERARLIALLLVGLLVGTALAAALYRPLWAGMATFQGVRQQGEPHGAASTAGALYLVLAHSPLRDVAGPLTSVALDGLFGVYVLFVSRRVRGAEDLLRACAGIAVVYLLVALPVYWPWYVALPLALLALAPHGAHLWMMLVLSCSARLAAPLEVMDNRGFLLPGISLFGTDVIAVGLPLLAVVSLIIREWRWQRRIVYWEEKRAVPVP